MKLSTAKWLAILGSLPSKNEQKTETSLASSSVAQRDVQPRDDETRVIHVSATVPYIVTEVIADETVFQTRYGTFDTVITRPTTDNVVELVPVDVDTTITIVGDLLPVSSGVTYTGAEIAALTEVSCVDQNTCTPTVTPITYDCPEVTTGAVLTTMQYYSCTAGETCTGQAFQTNLPCNCGSSTCTINAPFLPIGVVIVPFGEPLPPVLPEPGEIPWYTEPQPTLTITTASDGSNTDGDEMTSTVSSGASSSVSTTSSGQASSSSTVSPTTSSSTISSTSSASACDLANFSIPEDYSKTLEAWLSLFTFTLNTTVATTASSIPVSKSKVTVTLFTTVSSTISPTVSTTSVMTPTPTPTLTSAPTSVPILTSASSSSSTSWLFTIDTTLNPSFVSWQSAQSSQQAASISSASVSASKVEAMSRCEHYSVQAFPSPIPPEWWGSRTETDDKYLCLADPNKIDTGKDTWPADWEYQPFNVSNMWDSANPADTLLDKFCGTLADNSITVTYSGDTQGVCQTYDKGLCVARYTNNDCGTYEHISPAYNDATVVIAVTYRKNSYSCGDNEKKPQDFKKLGVAACKKKIKEKLIDRCTIKKAKAGTDWAKYGTLGGTLWDGCMMYTIIAVKHPPKW